MLIIDDKWMELALEKGREASTLDEVPMGAVLVCAGAVIGAGFNRRETTGLTTSHAEIVALEDYNRRTHEWRLPPATALYTTAEPCLMCAGALLQARIEAIIYGCQDPRNAGLRNLLPLIEEGRFDHRPSVIQGGVLADRAAAQLIEFFARRRFEKKLDTSLIH